MPIKRVREEREGGMFDFLIKRPTGRSPFLTDEEARVLYDLWKTSKLGDRRFVPGRSEINSLKAKGYLSGAMELELTPRGKKVIVEMVTNEPSVLEKSSEPPPYSKIKAAAKKRPRQSFLQKKGSKEERAFNLRNTREAMKKEAGVWDIISSPFRDWWAKARGRMGDWGSQMGATTGPERELWKKVEREKQIAQRYLVQIWNSMTDAATGVQGAAIARAVSTLMPALEEFRNVIGTVVPIMPPPPIPEAGEVIDKNQFQRFYDRLDQTVKQCSGPVGWQNVVQYARNKEHASISPLAMPKGAEDQTFENEFKRLVAAINRRVTDVGGGASEIIPKEVVDDILDNYDGMKLVDAMTDLVMKARGIEFVDNMASRITFFIMDKLNPKLSEYRRQLAAWLRSSGRGGRSGAYELNNWDKYIDQIEKDIAVNVKNIMQQKFTRLFGGQAPEAAGTRREMAT